MKFLIVGLGNIGSEYDSTRHNIGFEVADTFVLKNGGTYRLERHAYISEVRWKGKIFIVIKPTTYMNLSGKAVKYWMDKEKIPLENILVIVDDLALPLATLRLRASGSDAGHNGLKSMMAELHTDKYPRPAPVDEEIVAGAAVRAVDAIECFATQGIGKAMTMFNK